MVDHHSALLFIAMAQANLTLENSVEFIALVSAVQKQSRKYCMLVGCLQQAHNKFNRFFLHQVHN